MIRKSRDAAASQGAGRRPHDTPHDEVRTARHARIPGSTEGEGRPSGRPATRASADALVAFGRSDPTDPTGPFDAPDAFDPDEAFDAHDAARRGNGRVAGGNRRQASASVTADAATPGAAHHADGEDVYTRTSQRTSQSRNRPGRRASPFSSEPAAGDEGRTATSKRPERSLKGRALGYLSRREYSRAELARKLAPYIEEGDELEPLLDALEQEGWLSDARFAESLVHRRASRVGSVRILSELKRHALGNELVETLGAQLRDSELTRAQAVWRKKFGAAPQTPAERAKQARFLAMRGFSHATIAKLLKGAADAFDEDIGGE